MIQDLPEELKGKVENRAASPRYAATSRPATPTKSKRVLRHMFRRIRRTTSSSRLPSTSCAASRRTRRSRRTQRLRFRTDFRAHLEAPRPATPGGASLFDCVHKHCQRFASDTCEVGCERPRHPAHCKGRTHRSVAGAIARATGDRPSRRLWSLCQQPGSCSSMPRSGASLPQSPRSTPRSSPQRARKARQRRMIRTPGSPAPQTVTIIDGKSGTRTQIAVRTGEQVEEKAGSAPPLERTTGWRIRATERFRASRLMARARSKNMRGLIPRSLRARVRDCDRHRRSRHRSKRNRKRDYQAAENGDARVRALRQRHAALGRTRPQQGPRNPAAAADGAVRLSRQRSGTADAADQVLTAAQNIDRLHWFLSRLQGYVGVTNFMGGRFTSNESGAHSGAGRSFKRAACSTSMTARRRAVSQPRSPPPRRRPSSRPTS